MLSGKVTLMKYDDFQGNPIPELTERIKIKLREQDIDFFDYVGEYQPQPLYIKSLLIPNDFPNYKKQLGFDTKLISLDLFDYTNFGPQKEEFYKSLHGQNLTVKGFRIVKQHL